MFNAENSSLGISTALARRLIVGIPLFLLFLSITDAVKRSSSRWTPEVPSTTVVASKSSNFDVEKTIIQKEQLPWTADEVLQGRRGLEGYWLQKCGLYGGTGNKIISFLNVALESYNRNMELIMPTDCVEDEGLLNVTHVQKHTTPEMNIMKQTDGADAYYVFSYFMYSKTPGARNEYQEHRFPRWSQCLARQFVSPLVKHFDGPAHEELVIHIRSGDVMDSNGYSNNLWYTSPPLAFFQDVIERNKGKQIRLLTQVETKSAMADKLKELYPGVLLSHGDKQEDIKAILRAKHLVLSQGTFSYGLAIASTKLENLYIFRNTKMPLDPFIFANTNVWEYRMENIPGPESPQYNQAAFIMNTDRTNLKRRHIQGKC